MKARELLRNVVGDLNCKTAALALALLLGTLWIPALWDGAQPIPVGTGTVLATLEGSDTVVQLESGEHVAVEGLEAEVGSKIEIQNAPLLAPGNYDENVDHWFMPLMMGTAGTALITFLLMALGAPLLDQVEHWLWSRGRSRTSTYSDW